ncbi:MAG: hypothetical protein ACREMV_02695 [Gemmatimonadales bacterium]
MDPMLSNPLIVAVSLPCAEAPAPSETGVTDIHLAASGASELFVLAFGDKGKHARTAIGMAELPRNVPFEVEVTAVLE